MAWLEQLEVTPQAGSRGRGSAPAWKGFCGQGAAVLLVLLIWQIVHVAGWKKVVLPGQRNAANLWDLAKTGLLWQAIGNTMRARDRSGSPSRC